MRLLALAILTWCACCLGGCERANPPGPLPADNTAVNKRDAQQAEKTPIDQNENHRDVTLTAQIRKRVMDAKLSVNAQNIKIISQDGRVTLRGPVASAGEKNQLEAIAKEIAGPSNVDNQLEVPVSR